MLIDTHCHLADPAFDGDRDQTLSRAWAAGVVHVVAIGESRRASEAALALARRDARLSATAGVHPHDASGFDENTGTWLRGALQDPHVVAVGETGLDYHYDRSPRPVQQAVFERQLALAAETGKIAVIHARQADEDVAAILRDHPRARAVLHSFSSGPALLRAGLELGHYVSFSGMITFRNWTMDEAIRATPLDRILTETDAPYLAPVPYRGKRNEPAYVARVAERLAEVRGLAPEEMIRITGANATRAFGARVSQPSQGAVGVQRSL